MVAHESNAYYQIKWVRAMNTGRHEEKIEREYLTCEFGDFAIDCVSRADLVEWCMYDISRTLAQPKLIMDINGHAISLAKTDENYRNLVKNADIIHADGGFLVTLSRWLCVNKIPERSATTDMIHDFSLKFSTTGNSFYLLGATEEVNKLCYEKLIELYPGINIVGRHHGYFSTREEDEIVSEINALKPDIVWIGLGKPREQEIAVNWQKKLKGPTWLITCGGCYNYITGHYPRAPKWMQRRNLEWLHRLATNPRKLFWRYITTTPHAIIIALRQHR